MKKNKVLLFILVSVAELIGTILALIVLPIVVGEILTGQDISAENWFHIWFGGIALIFFGIGAALVIIYIIFRGIPALIKYNLRRINKMMGVKEIYCHKCTDANINEAAKMKSLVYHAPPECAK